MRSTRTACGGCSTMRQSSKRPSPRSQWARPSRWSRRYDRWHRRVSQTTEEIMWMKLLARTAIVAVALTFAWSTRAAEPDWPDTLTIGAGSPGGTYYIYGAGLARILSRELALPVVMRPKEGPA